MTGIQHSTNNLNVVAFTNQVCRIIEQLESGQDSDIETLQSLLAQMDQMANAVVELALQHPLIPAQFSGARQRLRVHIRNRRLDDVNKPLVGFPFQGLVDLVRAEQNLRGQQDTLDTEAWALLMRGDTKAAAQRLGEALDFLDRRRSFVADEKQQIFFAKEGKYLVARFLNEYLQRQDWSHALELVERTKSRALLSQLGLSDIRKPTNIRSALADKEKDLLEQAREAADEARLNATTGDGVRGFELWNRAATLQLELNKVWSALAKHSTWAEYVSLRSGTSPDLQQMRDCLGCKKVKPGTALLSYLTDEKTTWLFVLGWDAQEPVAVDTGVPPDHLRACAQRLLIDCNGLAPGFPINEDLSHNKLIEEALKLPPTIHRRNREIPYPDPRKLLGPKYAFTYLDDLSSSLLPLSVHPLLQNCAVLCISPHGPLHALPLHALRWSDGTYVAERFGVCYVPSAGVLRHCQNRNRARRAPAPYMPRTGLVACVDMFGEQSGEFERDRELLAPLTKSKSENRACKVLSGSEGRRPATKQRVIKEAGKTDIIHLSCHGIFARDRGWTDPLQSGILLADGKRSRIDCEDLGQKPQDLADCLLTAREIYNLSLKADLVTLGACDTGRSQLEAGDDLLGLSRAWLYAGSSSVLLGLWKVNTQSSHRLLQVFYQQWLEAGEPKWRALQTAQKALRNDEANQNFRHPYHWAPFVLIGDWV